MNWGKLLLAGIAGGIALDVANFIMHGFIMGPAYTRYPIFDTDPANPLHFLLTDVLIALTMALLFAKTRNSWSQGAMGGLLFGILVGLVAFFPHFYNPLVLQGFPYYMSWCWGGITVIGYAVAGTVMGLIYKR